MTCFIKDCKNETVETVTLSTGAKFKFCNEHFNDFAYFFTKSALSKKSAVGQALNAGYEKDMERMTLGKERKQE